MCSKNISSIRIVSKILMVVFANKTMLVFDFPTHSIISLKTNIFSETKKVDSSHLLTYWLMDDCSKYCICNILQHLLQFMLKKQKLINFGHLNFFYCDQKKAVKQEKVRHDIVSILYSSDMIYLRHDIFKTWYIEDMIYLRYDIFKILYI